MRIAARTDIGATRSENQDSYWAIQFPDGRAWAVVCDGMGGANAGSVASGMAVDTMRQLAELGLDKISPGDERPFLLRSLEGTSRKIYEAAAADKALNGMGTTAVQVLVQDGVAHIAHMGDSRAYRLHGKELEQITRDHSYVQEMLESGKLTPEEAAKHPQKNLITRALGVDPRLQAEYTNCTVVPGDILLLCTDGLSNTVDRESITQTLLNVSFYDAPERLVKQAMAGGSQDNITALLIGIEPVEA